MGLPRQENKLKAQLVGELGKAGGVVIGHQDFRISGVPDLSWTIEYRTWWLEIKHATPKCNSRGIQERTMRRLAHAGWARYIVYLARQEQQNWVHYTLIIHPNHFAAWHEKGDGHIEASCIGHSHAFVVQYLLSEHRP